MKGVVKLEKTGAKPTDEWKTSPEYAKAMVEYLGVDFMKSTFFEHSQEFANARQAYRKRING